MLNAWQQVVTPTVTNESMQLPSSSVDDETNPAIKTAPWLAQPTIPKPTVPDTISESVTSLLSRKELESAILDAAPNKATGTNNQRSNELKISTNISKDIILAIFNLAQIDGIQPSSWKSGLVILIHKKGPAENPLNYRPIALLQTLYKLYTAILNARLVTAMESVNAISKIQAGFLRKRGTAEQIANHIATLQNAKHNKRELHVTYIDLQKAFDTVPIIGIQQALQRYKMSMDHGMLQRREK